jgi:hypothetical protein
MANRPGVAVSSSDDRTGAQFVVKLDIERRSTFRRLLELPLKKQNRSDGSFSG